MLEKNIILINLRLDLPEDYDKKMILKKLKKF